MKILILQNDDGQVAFRSCAGKGRWQLADSGTFVPRLLDRRGYWQACAFAHVAAEEPECWVGPRFDTAEECALWLEMTGTL